MSLLQPKIILAALDTSPRAAGVLAEAIDLAQKLGGKLVLVRAVGIPHELPAEAFTESPQRIPEILERIARQDLEQRAKDVPEGLLAKLLVTTGVPWEVICRDAEQEGADLIVIGSHGYSGIDRLLGTTASRVVNHANRSVLVVREPASKQA
ncbi:MAG: universal stress protein [Polyangiaceae bacterium]|nr:universal stress protein [Polyangiaceae bacterium]